jgi:hypothetical protein
MALETAGNRDNIHGVFDSDLPATAKGKNHDAQRFEARLYRRWAGFVLCDELLCTRSREARDFV